MREIADLMRADIGIRCDDAHLRPVDSEVERLWADNSKLKNFNMASRVEGKAGFQRGLRETVDGFVRFASGSLAKEKLILRYIRHRRALPPLQMQLFVNNAAIRAEPRHQASRISLNRPGYFPGLFFYRPPL